MHGLANAEPDRRAAAELFRAGEQAFARGDHTGAALTFEQAYAQAPEAATAFAAATAWYKAGDLPRAADAYDRAVAHGGLPPDREAHAKSRLEQLRAELGRIEVRAPEGRRASVAYQRAALIPFTVYVPPGSHRVLLDGATDDGGEASVSVAAGELRSVDFELPREAEGPVAPSPPPRVERGAVGPSPVLGWVALGAGVVAAGGAFYVRTRAVDSVEEYDTTGDEDAKDRAKTERTVSYALWGVAGALGATGITILLWPRSETTVALSSSGMALRGRF
jgi:hypothetical protein